MKKISLFTLLVLASAVTFAQTVAVSGTVNDQKGKPVPFAFIRDSQHSFATFSDSTGAFSFKADPSSQLIAAAPNFQALQVPISSPANVKIVLPGDVAAPIAVNNSVFSAGGAIDNIQGARGSVTGVNEGQEATHGSRFVFPKWVHGYTIGADNSITQNDAYLFNYSKLDGVLVFSPDAGSLHQTIRDQVKGFTLFDDAAQPYVFENVPAIDNAHYVLVIGTGSKYKIYKVYGTKYIKANFTTSGVSSSGNKYDEYVDDSTYFLVKMPDGQPQKLAAKKKAIKAAFPADADKVNKYITDNDRDIDDAYLKGLLDILNQ